MSDEPNKPGQGEGAAEASAHDPGTAETAESGAETGGDERRLTDDERAALLKEQLKRLRVIDVVYDMMVQLVQLGYQKLGLTEETRELRNLDDARVAVEALRRLIEVAESEGDTDMASLQATLAQLQLSFARAARQDSAAGQPESGERSGGSRAEGRDTRESRPSGEGETNSGDEPAAEEEPETPRPGGSGESGPPAGEA